MSRDTVDLVLGPLRLGDALMCLRRLADVPADKRARVWCSRYNLPAVEAVQRLTTLRMDEVRVVDADGPALPRIDSERSYWSWCAMARTADDRTWSHCYYSWRPEDGLFGNLAPLPAEPFVDSDAARIAPHIRFVTATLRREPPPEPAEVPALTQAVSNLAAAALVGPLAARRPILGMMLLGTPPQHPAVPDVLRDSWDGSTAFLPPQMPPQSFAGLGRALQLGAAHVGIASAPAVLAALLGVPTIMVWPAGRFDGRWLRAPGAWETHVTHLLDPTAAHVEAAVLAAVA